MNNKINLFLFSTLLLITICPSFTTNSKNAQKPSDKTPRSKPALPANSKIINGRLVIDPVVGVNTKRDEEILKFENLELSDPAPSVVWEDGINFSDEVQKGKKIGQLDIEDDGLDNKSNTSQDSQEIIEQLQREFEEKLILIAKEKDRQAFEAEAKAENSAKLVLEAEERARLIAEGARAAEEAARVQAEKARLQEENARVQEERAHKLELLIAILEKERAAEKELVEEERQKTLEKIEFERLKTEKAVKDAVARANEIGKREEERLEMLAKEKEELAKQVAQQSQNKASSSSWGDWLSPLADIAQQISTQKALSDLGDFLRANGYF